MGVIRQFLTEVNWGPLDYLVVDLPPGTGDEALTIAQCFAPNLRGAVIVTTPQDVAASLDAVKAAQVHRNSWISPVLGIIENMKRAGLPPLRRVGGPVRQGRANRPLRTSVSRTWEQSLSTLR